MRIRTLGRSGLRVSELCLGTMTFGTSRRTRGSPRTTWSSTRCTSRSDHIASSTSCGPAAAEAGCTPAQLAIAWQLAKPEVTSVILGARSQAQLDDTLAAAETSVPEEVLARLDGASAIPLEYPNAFIDTIQRWLGNR